MPFPLDRKRRPSASAALLCVMLAIAAPVIAQPPARTIV